MLLLKIGCIQKRRYGLLFTQKMLPSLVDHRLEGHGVLVEPFTSPVAGNTRTRLSVYSVSSTNVCTALTRRGCRSVLPNVATQSGCLLPVRPDLSCLLWWSL